MARHDIQVIGAGRRVGLAVRWLAWPVRVLYDAAWTAWRTDTLTQWMRGGVSFFLCVSLSLTAMFGGVAMMPAAGVVDNTIPRSFFIACLLMACGMAATLVYLSLDWGIAVRRLWTLTVAAAWPRATYDAAWQAVHAGWHAACQSRALLVTLLMFWSVVFGTIWAWGDRAPKVQPPLWDIALTWSLLLFTVYLLWRQCVAPLLATAALFLWAVVEGAGGAAATIKEFHGGRCAVCFRKKPRLVGYMCSPGVIHRCVCAECHRDRRPVACLTCMQPLAGTHCIE